MGVGVLLLSILSFAKQLDICRSGIESLVRNPHSAELSRYAIVDALYKTPTKDIRQFEPQVGIRVTKRDDRGRPLEGVIRVLSDNAGNQISILADYNQWGKALSHEDYLRPIPNTPYFEGTVRELRDGMEYRLLLNGREVLDPASIQYTSKSFLNSVFRDVSTEAVTRTVDFRGRPVLIGEEGLYELAAKWTERGQKGPRTQEETYRFIAESGLPRKMAEMGYTHVEFLPFNSFVDGDAWYLRYQSYGLYGPDSRYGSPAEFREMVQAFNRAGVGVVMDAVWAHYPTHAVTQTGQRDIQPVGQHHFINYFGKSMFGERPTVWGTNYYDLENPYVRQFILEAGLQMRKLYGISGIRIDHIDGIRAQPGGDEFLKAVGREFAAYDPGFLIIGEMFSDHGHSLTRTDWGGQGFHSANDVDFFYSFVQKFLQARDEEIDLWRLKNFIDDAWRWDRAPMQRWITNHDESANKQPGASGDYVATLINGGGWEYVEKKSKVWGALGMSLGSVYLDMPQMRFLQEGNLNNNPNLDWDVLSHQSQNRTNEFFSHLTRTIRDIKAFAPENLHPHLMNHVDNDNKVLSVLRVDYASNRKYYAVINLGSRDLKGYRLGVDGAGVDHYRAIVHSDAKDFIGGQIYKPGAGEHGKPNSVQLDIPAYGFILLEQN